MKSNSYPVNGVGLGLRRDMLGELGESQLGAIDFLEIAPENWIGIGGPLAKELRKFTEQYPFIIHGLSLSIGSPAPLDETLIRSIGKFMRAHDILLYSEHLSYCSDSGHLYDLMPIPFTDEAVDYVAKRIQRVQDLLGQRIAMENVSYYAAPGAEMTEIEFLNAVLSEADCDLLLDINNIYVNSVNHNYDATEFLRELPAERIVYAHIAGHHQEAEDLIIDTHGAEIVEPVWALLDIAYEHFGIFPTLIERDFNIPPMAELMEEVHTLRRIQQKHLPETAIHA